MILAFGRRPVICSSCLTIFLLLAEAGQRFYLIELNANMINNIFRYKYAPKQNLKEKIEKTNEKMENESFYQKIDNGILDGKITSQTREKEKIFEAFPGEVNTISKLRDLTLLKERVKMELVVRANPAEPISVQRACSVVYFISYVVQESISFAQILKIATCSNEIN
ncbi:hypothetical protein ABPG72_014519 [Tetrahymena utriculariae]